MASSNSLLAASSRLGPAYWRLWAATTVSCFGDGLSMVAMPLLALRLTSDPRLIAGAAVAKQLPWLLVALPAGALADRFDRRRLMVGTDVARMAALVVFAGIVVTDSLTLPVLYASAFVFGSLECLFAGAAGAALPSLVPERELDRANGYLYATETVAGQLAGPAVGAALFAAPARRTTTSAASTARLASP